MSAVLWHREPDRGSEMLTSAGLQVVYFPLIATVESDDLSELATAVRELASFDGVFITSRIAAEIFAREAANEIMAVRPKIFVLGERSFETLKTSGGDVWYDPEAATADEMLDRLGEMIKPGGRYIFVRGERSMRTIPERLGPIADVRECVVYRTTAALRARDRVSEVLEILGEDERPIACFFSPSAVEEFSGLFGSDGFSRVRTAAIGETTAEALRSHGSEPEIVSPAASAEALAAAVIELVKDDGS